MLSQSLKKNHNNTALIDLIFLSIICSKFRNNTPSSESLQTKTNFEKYILIPLFFTNYSILESQKYRYREFLRDT